MIVMVMVLRNRIRKKKREKEKMEPKYFILIGTKMAKLEMLLKASPASWSKWVGYKLYFDDELGEIFIDFLKKYCNIKN